MVASTTVTCTPMSTACHGAAVPRRSPDTPHVAASAQIRSTAPRRDRPRITRRCEKCCWSPTIGLFPCTRRSTDTVNAS